MSIQLRGHKDRTARVIKLWRQIATDYESGLTIADLEKKYGYARPYFYRIFKRLNELDKSSA